VATGSDAAKAGLAVGDEIVTMDGHYVLSIADIQWALQKAPQQGIFKLGIQRHNERKLLTMDLPSNWRRRDGFAWRYTYNELKWKVLGLDQLKDVEEEEREKLGIEEDESAIRIGRVIQGTDRWRQTYCNLKAWNVGLRDEDIIVDIDLQRKLDASGFMAYILQQTKPGDDITLTVLRDGTRKQFKYQLNSLRNLK
jgi:S1-C subfamily serine protease